MNRTAIRVQMNWTKLNEFGPKFLYHYEKPNIDSPEIITVNKIGIAKWDPK